MHPHDVRARRSKVRSDRRRMWRHAQLWVLRRPGQLRRGRDHQPMRLHEDHVRRRWSKLWNHLRRLRQRARMRSVSPRPDV